MLSFLKRVPRGRLRLFIAAANPNFKTPSFFSSFNFFTSKTENPTNQNPVDVQDVTSEAEVVEGSATWLGRGLSCVCVQGREGDSRPSFDLTPAQEHCLQRLQNRLDIAYDSSIPGHQAALKSLWKAAFPEEELRDIISEQWKEMGWQRKDPSTDFWGGGFISLENLLYFARNFPVFSHYNKNLLFRTHKSVLK